MKAVVIVALVAAVAVGAWFMFGQGVVVPDAPLVDTDGNPTNLSEIRGDADGLLMVFVSAKCRISKFSLGVIDELEDMPGLQIAGLSNGTAEKAAQEATDLELSFPMYSLRDSPDPFRTNEMMQVVGEPRGSGWIIQGGSVVVLDDQNKIQLKLIGDEVRDLPAKLADLGY